MKKNLIIVALAVLAFAVPALAQTGITVSFGNDSYERLFADSSQTLLPTGSTILLGSFAAGTDFSSTDYSYLSGNFSQYGKAAIGDGGFGSDLGVFLGKAIDTPTSKKLFFWAFNSASESTATEWGIFSSSAAKWTTPSSGPDLITLDIIEADVHNFGELTATYAMTSAVPEPSTYAAILGFVTLGLVGYRRFRRR